MKPAQLVVLLGGAGVPTAPTLSAPANAAVLDDTTPEFSWQAVPGAVTYDIEIRATLTGTPTATGITGTTYTPSALDAALTYNWRVRAVNAVGAGAWSAARTFSFDYATYMASLNRVLWRRYRETGADANVNSGTVSLTITQSNITRGQQGAGGAANEAHAWNGSTSYEQVNDSDALDLASFTVMMLVKPANAGGANAGRFYTHGTEFIRFAGETMILSAIVDTDATDAVSATSTTLTPDAWCWLEMSFDNAGDRKIKIYIDGVEAAYSTQTAATGTRAASALNFFVGSTNATPTGQYNGLIDEFHYGSLLTPAQTALIRAKKPANP